MLHREERVFSITLHLAAEFEEDYAGDEDGYAWHERFVHELRPRITSALFEALRSAPGWKAVAAPRGRDPEQSLDIDLVRRVESDPQT